MVFSFFLKELELWRAGIMGKPPVENGIFDTTPLL
jgi:hypothetical protein